MFISSIILSVFFLALPIVCANIVSPGPTYWPTEGEVWPAPQAEKKQKTFFTFSPLNFEFTIANKKCEILNNAIHRYKAILKDLFNIARQNRGKNSLKSREEDMRQRDGYYQGHMKVLELNLTESCEEYPSFKMDESYTLTISSTPVLTSHSIWGMLKGMETVSQLFYISDNEVRINATEIFDFPHYFHRGLMLDTSRHYLSVANILKTLDAMAMNKMNVLHWHIVDDQSFPYQSDKFPELSQQGAYSPSLVYTKPNIEAIVEYARDRGIRVIPEFDVPGHTRSWGVSHPRIFTKCYNNDVATHLGPLHPLRKSTYKLLLHLFREVQNLFPDKYFHVGGDEVDFHCWRSNPDIQKFIARNDIPSVDELNIMFMNKVFLILGTKSKPIVWQDAYDSGVRVPEDALVQVWKNEWRDEVADVLNSNQSVILSSPWYLDHLQKTFASMYVSDPRTRLRRYVKAELLKNIAGGEACLWSEMVNDHNMHTRIWPRSSAVAEVLWSVTRGLTRPELFHRLEEHACRMNRRGIPAEPPSGPGFCLM